MEILLDVPQGQFRLQRWPIRKNELLKAWDAADEYLLNYFATEVAPAANAPICILNDSFGALGVALNPWRPAAISDSFLSQSATRNNLDANGLNSDAVQLLQSLQLPGAGIEYLLIKVPKTLALLEYQLHQLRPLLNADCKVIAAGMVKNLPASVWKILAEFIGPTATSLAVKKARLIFATVDPMINLAENPYPVSYQLENTNYRIWNHANVFSRDSLDIGSRFLLQHLPDNPEYRHVVDLGCGNGVIGLIMAAISPEINVSFVDESFMAIASARQNFQAAFGHLRQAEFKVDDCLSSFSENSADCIICNPPFHQQQTIGDHIAWQMFQQARLVLRKGGELRVIGNRHLNYHLHLKKLFGGYDTVASNNKFVIVKSIKR